MTIPHNTSSTVWICGLNKLAISSTPRGRTCVGKEIQCTVRRNDVIVVVFLHPCPCWWHVLPRPACPWPKRREMLGWPELIACACVCAGGRVALSPRSLSGAGAVAGEAGPDREPRRRECLRAGAAVLSPGAEMRFIRSPFTREVSTAVWPSGDWEAEVPCPA